MNTSENVGMPTGVQTLYVLLPVHNRREITRRFVACYNAQTYTNRHLVLIDDGSVDDTCQMVRAEVSDLTIITGTGNWWWAGALQQGYKWLVERGAEPDDVVLIINDDTEFEKDFFECALNLLQDIKGALLMAEAYDRETGDLIGRGVHFDCRHLSFVAAASPAEINCLETCGLFMRYEDFVATNGFYPRLLPHYLSDYEYTIRAHRNGMKLWTDSRLRLVVDTATTGLHNFDTSSFFKYCREYFAKNSTSNPFYWSTFVALACPWPWKLTGWLRVWYGTAKKLSSVFCGYSRR